MNEQQTTQEPAATQEQGVPEKRQRFKISCPDGNVNNATIVLLGERPEDDVEISRFCLGAQIVLKPGKQAEATLYLAAAITDIVAEGKVQEWKDIMNGYYAAERARIAEELAYFKSGLTIEYQSMMDNVIKDITESRTRKILDQERKSKM